MQKNITPSCTDAAPALGFTRRYAAAPEKVWRAWTDPQALAQWFGPEAGSVVSIADLDVRVGGRYHIRFGVPGEEENDVPGTYQEVEPGRKLVFSRAWKSTPGRVSRVTVVIEPEAGGTELVFRHEQFFDQIAAGNHGRGWTAAFTCLDRFLGGALSAG
jgi:uncharacterized protein YndB with AHSA1/START domain